LLAQQVRFEINELSSPTALRRFGAPFKGDRGEVRPQDSELPLLRYIFVHHVRTFPFLDQAKEKEFWQDRVQTFLESFATKQISSSDDRLEESKRRKLAKKAEKLVEIMMVSGIPTASGYEERIRFAEMEVVDRGAQEQGLVANTPEGSPINGWDVNIAGVRMKTVKKHWGRSSQEGEYIIRVKTAEAPEFFVVRTYDDFKKMHSQLRVELAGKVLPPLPKRNTTDYVMPNFVDDSDSLSSFSSEDTSPVDAEDRRRSRGLSIRSNKGSPKIGTHDSNSSLQLSHPEANDSGNLLKPEGFRSKLKEKTHKRPRSISGISGAFSPKPPSSPRLPGSPRASSDSFAPPVLFREAQRVSLRASLRILLQNQHIARSKSMQEFLLANPVNLTDVDLGDLERRKVVDEKRIEEQRQFYEIASKRAAEVDVHMEKFRRDIIESSEQHHFFSPTPTRTINKRKVIERPLIWTEPDGLRKLFASIKHCNTIADLPPEHKKVAEWLRIEYFLH
jgi:hypothetical protein